MNNYYNDDNDDDDDDIDWLQREHEDWTESIRMKKMGGI